MILTNSESDRMVNIYMGELYVAEKPTRILTLLGSCVAVCLWDASLRLGGMNHYLLPSPDREYGKSYDVGKAGNYRYGCFSIESLIQRLLFAGSARSNLVAKIFGGGDVMYDDGLGKPRGKGIGQKNIEVAERILDTIDIPIVGRDVGGRDGRKIIFDTDTGQVVVRKLRIEKVSEEQL